MKRSPHWLVALTVLAAVQPVTVQLTAQDDPKASQWTQLRGSSGRGIADAQARPAVKIDLKKQTKWETEIPGTGWSSPVYTGELVWMTTAISTKATKEEIAAKLKGDRLAQIKTLAATVELRAIAVNRNTGKMVHNQLLTTVNEPEPINPMNSYASPTPALKDGKVVCHFGSYGTWCLDATTAQPVWDTRYVVKHSVGPGSSPIIVDDKVILVCDGTDKQFIVAVDLATGKQVWKTDRPPIRATDGEYRKAYCTPIEIKVNGQRQLVIPGAQWIAAYDPENGREIWRADHGQGFSVTPMPVYDSGLVVFSTGYVRPEFVAIDPTGKGDVTETHVKWRVRGAPTMPSFVVDSGRLYSVTDKGILICIDVKTGEVLKRDRLGGNYSASPLLAAGKLYLPSRDGALKIVTCSSELETIATNQFDSSILASPILIGDDLLIRTEKKLIRIKP